MRRVIWEDVDDCERKQILARPVGAIDKEIESTAQKIIDDVAARGDAAITDQSVRLDGFAPRMAPVGEGASRARRMLGAADLEAIHIARRNIEAFHAAEKPTEFTVETRRGVSCQRIWRPVDSVGLYAPGGIAPLFSSVLMLAIPARLAGVSRIVIASPPQKDGEIAPMIALAAELCGIEEVFLIGGAQAVAALAFGSQWAPKVAKICGPGNAYVAAAKALVSARQGGPAIDMPAGPSELMVIADSSIDPEITAADLLSQAEHDRLAQVILVATNASIADDIEQVLRKRLAALPMRDIAEAAITNAKIIIVNSLASAASIANDYAPEHLAIQIAGGEEFARQIKNAGTIFCGAGAAETFGDYLAGPSHVLPTDGAARSHSGVSVFTFLKSMAIQTVSDEGARTLAPIAARLARLEGLEAHARAAEARLAMAEAC